MYICDKCGEQVEYLETTVQYETFDGRRYPSMEYEIETCHCGGQYQEATKCPVCGDWRIEDDRDCCESCFEKITTPEICKVIGYNPFDIHFFLRFVFSDDEIETILEREFDKLDENLKKKYCREFALEFDDFAKKVAERNKSEDLFKR